MGVRRIGLLTVAALVFLPSAGLADTPTLVGTVGPGFSISLADPAGQPVKNVDPGAYTVQVHDESELHSFHLVGPGVDQATEVETEGDFNWPVTLSDGGYRYFCDVHPSLNGSFTVGTPPLPPVPKLLGKVGPGAKISLTTAGGTRVRSLVASAYVLTVRDLSARDNFHLTGPGVNRKTGVGQKRTVTWKLTLRAGGYRYRSDAHAKLKGSFVVNPIPQ
jgi:hypothetical protein